MKPTLKCWSACLVCHCTQSFFILFGVKNLQSLEHSAFLHWLFVFWLLIHVNILTSASWSFLSIFCLLHWFFFLLSLPHGNLYFYFKNYLIFWDLFSLCSTECLRTHVDQTDLAPPNAKIKGACFFSHLYCFTVLLASLLLW